MQLLHIVATPREAESTTLRVSRPFLQRLQARLPDLEVKTLNLFTDDLPAVAGQNIESKYSLMVGQPIDRNHTESWKHIEALIDQFMTADIVLISTPMWNFSIPYALKYYIDAIVQPGYLFTFDAQGVPIGLCQDRRMVCITARGGDYSEGSPMHSHDRQEPYLRTIFGFVGITEIEFINAQPMDVTPELREAAIGAAIEAACALADRLEWHEQVPLKGERHRVGVPV